MPDPAMASGTALLGMSQPNKREQSMMIGATNSPTNKVSATEDSIPAPELPGQIFGKESAPIETKKEGPVNNSVQNTAPLTPATTKVGAQKKEKLAQPGDLEKKQSSKAQKIAKSLGAGLHAVSKYIMARQARQGRGIGYGTEE